MIDIKVYLTDKPDLNDPQIKFDFLGYFSAYVTSEGDVHTYEDVVSSGTFFEEIADGCSDDRCFNSYVISRKHFESDKIRSSALKNEIRCSKRYNLNRSFEYIAFQRF